jgi:hypothetical protein
MRPARFESGAVRRVPSHNSALDGLPPFAAGIPSPEVAVLHSFKRLEVDPMT